MSECDFLGFTIKGKKIRWTDKARAFFKHRVKELTARSWGFARTQTVLRTVCVRAKSRCLWHRSALQGCPWTTGCANWGNIFGGGRRTSTSASPLCQDACVIRAVWPAFFELTL